LDTSSRVGLPRSPRTKLSPTKTIPFSFFWISSANWGRKEK
jgi:hypothetical protein